MNNNAFIIVEMDARDTGGDIQVCTCLLMSFNSVSGGVFFFHVC